MNWDRDETTSKCKQHINEKWVNCVLLYFEMGTY